MGLHKIRRLLQWWYLRPGSKLTACLSILCILLLTHTAILLRQRYTVVIDDYILDELPTYDASDTPNDIINAPNDVTDMPKVYILGNDTKYEMCDRCFPRDYRYIHLPYNVCDILKGQHKDDLKILFFIITKPADLSVRDSIRHNWVSLTQQNTAPSVRHVFVLGSTPDRAIQKLIDSEQVLHNDIVQQDFRDAYNNLTLKTMLGLEWATTHCARASYVMKVDDDVFANVHRLLALTSNAWPKTGLFGRCYYANRPQRRGRSKWRVPKDQYPGEVYPVYCNGPGYVVSMAAAHDVVRVSADIPFFRLEDVYIGLCFRALKMKYRIRHYAHWIDHVNLRKDTNATTIDCARMSRVITTHHTYPKGIEIMWNKCFKDRPLSKQSGIHVNFGF